MTTQQIIEKAIQIGRTSFHAGAKSTPAFCKELTEFRLAVNPSSMNLRLSAAIFKGWSHGWHTENAKRGEEFLSKLAASK